MVRLKEKGVWVPQTRMGLKDQKNAEFGQFRNTKGRCHGIVGGIRKEEVLN